MHQSAVYVQTCECRAYANAKKLSRGEPPGRVTLSQLSESNDVYRKDARAPKPKELPDAKARRGSPSHEPDTEHRQGDSKPHAQGGGTPQHTEHKQSDKNDRQAGKKSVHSF